MQIKTGRGIRATSSDAVYVGTLEARRNGVYTVRTVEGYAMQLDAEHFEFAGVSAQELRDAREAAEKRAANAQRKPSASARTYTVAGYSTLNGSRKLRVANNLKARVARLKQCGHTEVALVELPCAMTRTEAAEYVAAEGVE